MEMTNKPDAFEPDSWRLECAERTFAARIPTRYREVTVTNPEVQAWVSTVLAGEPRSLLLAGHVGAGKTHNAYAAIMATARGMARLGRSWTWAAVTHPQLNEENRPGGDGIDLYREVDLLFLDDLGAAHVTSWNADAAYRLVDHRWAHSLPTLFTTNLLPAELEESLGKRLVDRLFGMCQRVAFTGESWRRR